MLDQFYMFYLDCCDEANTQKRVYGRSVRTLTVRLWRAQLSDGTGCWSFPAGQEGTTDALCYPRLRPSIHLHSHSKAEGLPALHLGCPNASSEVLEPGTCFSNQIEPLFLRLPAEALKLLHPPRPQQKAPGRGEAWLCGQPERILCVPALRCQHGRGEPPVSIS